MLSGAGIAIFALQFIASEIIGKAITGAFMKTMADQLARDIRKGRDLASKYLGHLWQQTKDLTTAVNRAVAGMKRTSFRNA